MLWKETCAMDQRMRFVVEYEFGEEPMAALCRKYGISRRVGYKWLGRYLAEGRRLEGSFASAAQASQRDRCQHGAGYSGGSCGSCDVGPQETVGLAVEGTARGAPAGAEHDCRVAQASWSGGAEEVSPARSAARRAVRLVRRSQRRLVCRLQRILPYGRRPTLRSADDQRCL